MSNKYLKNNKDSIKDKLYNSLYSILELHTELILS